MPERLGGCGVEDRVGVAVSGADELAVDEVLKLRGACHGVSFLTTAKRR
jgi:hypothetical protein